MKKTGLLLKEKRESAGLSISEVALATKINPKILSAIENGDSSNLPAKTFLKGFLRSYALFLKLDVDDVLRLYQEECGGPVPERVHEAYKNDPAAPPQRRRVDEENSSSLRTAAVVVIVLLIGLIIGVRELIEKYQREKVVESAQIKVSPLNQPPVIPESAKVLVDNSTAVPVPVPGADAAAPATASATPSPLAVPATVEPKPAEKVAEKPTEKIAEKPADKIPAPVTPKVPEVKAPEVKPVAKAPEPAKPEPPKVAEKPAEKPAADKKPASTSETADAPKSAIKNIKSEIILEALDRVDVKFQLKGETKKLSLAPNEVHTIYADQSVILDLSDGGAVNIILNGRDRGPAGELGKPKQVTLP